ncbi:uncharacterized protein LOC128236224 isoform X2 [Mya arenaria]|uniref:uncharacterized protein LOC128236224 isoform X2 n=1 Tax=Mya arenaria TaxID=6604 RepID=UPI0022E0A85B|nr:uncharacterized protein LOC128236224 isoform X2 [Mya arenaria]
MFKLVHNIKMDLPVSVIIFVLCRGMLIFGQDNGLHIDFQRIVEDGGSANIEQIQVDSSSTDTFQIMCRVNNVNELFKINTLRLQFTSNGQDYTELARLQNTDAANVDTQKPVLASGAGSSWTVEGSFGTNINGREGTLGVSRPVSSITCSNAVEYRCQLTYTKPGPGYISDTGIISKVLDVQVLPTTITRNVYNMSSLSSLPVTVSDTIEPFYVGQTVKMECSANIGSFNGTAQIRWIKSNILAGSPLTPYFSPDTELGDPQSADNCVYQQTDSVTYNMTAQDASRMADNRLHFQCYVDILSMNWETAVDRRGNFKFIVYSRSKTSHDDTSVSDKKCSSKGTVTGGVFGGVVGGVVALATIVVAVLIISRRYQFPCMQTSDNAKNTKMQSDPVVETQTASPYEHLATRAQTEYTAIGMTAVGQSGAGSPNNETSSYERLHARENAAYTELGAYSPESQTQVESQQTDSHTASSNYEVPANRVMM